MNVLVLLLGSVALSQNAYRQGINVFHTGIGFGLAGIYEDATLPRIATGLEDGLKAKISLRGIFGFAGSSSKIAGYGGWSCCYVMIGARARTSFWRTTASGTLTED